MNKEDKKLIRSILEKHLGEIDLAAPTLDPKHLFLEDLYSELEDILIAAEDRGWENGYDECREY